MPVTDLAGLFVLCPDRARIAAIQSAEGSYYFSAAFEAVLRKHGYIDVRSLAALPADGADCGFVSRSTPWLPALAGKALVFEGPLDRSVCHELGLDPQDRQADEWTARDTSNWTWQFCYSQFSVKRIPRFRWSRRTEAKPFRCADPRWNKSDVSCQTFERATGWQTLLELRDPTTHTWHPVAIKRDNTLVFGLPMFDWLVYEHCFPPLADGGYYAFGRLANAEAIGGWLLGHAGAMFIGCGARLLRAGHWPAGHRSAFTLRHDYDRPINHHTHGRIMNLYAELAVKSSWFWLNRHHRASQVREILARGHEVALHSEAHSEREFVREQRVFTTNTGVKSKGVTAHGGRGAPGYLGYTSNKWALRAGCAYGEMLGKGYLWPICLVRVDAGIPEPVELMLPPPHYSLDLSTDPGGHDLDNLLRLVPECLGRGGYVIVMNHPDIHFAQLEYLLRTIDLRSAWRATLAETMSWTRVTKFRSDVQRADDRATLILSEPLRWPFEIRITSAETTRSLVMPPGQIEMVLGSSRLH
jgi:peptidoglycan/xylan/chitin deacetylase (PgdA/CDA1 family)